MDTIKLILHSKWIKVPWNPLLRKGLFAFVLGIVACAYTLNPDSIRLSSPLHLLGLVQIMVGFLLLFLNLRDRLSSALLALGGLFVVGQMPGLWWLPLLSVLVVFSGAAGALLGTLLILAFSTFPEWDVLEFVAVFLPIVGSSFLLVLLLAWLSKQKKRDLDLKQRFRDLVQSSNVALWEYHPDTGRVKWGKNEFKVSIAAERVAL